MSGDLRLHIKNVEISRKHTRFNDSNTETNDLNLPERAVSNHPNDDIPGRYSIKKSAHQKFKMRLASQNIVKRET